MQDFFSYFIRQQTIQADVTVGCQSTGRRVSSISDLLAPAAKAAPAGPPAPASCGRLCCRAGLSAPYYSHRWPWHPSTHHTCCYSPATADEPVNPRTVVLPSAWETTAESSLPPCRSLPRPRRRPRPGALGAAWSMWSTTDMHLKWTVRGEADSWVHGRTQGNASLLRAK